MRDRESESENSRLDLLFTEVTLAKLSDSLVSVLVHYMSSVLSTKRSKYYLQHLILHDVRRTCSTSWWPGCSCPGFRDTGEIFRT